MSSPEITIALPIYHPEVRHFRACLGAIGQCATRVALEVVVTDDSDTSDAQRVIASELDGVVPWRYEHNTSRLGLAENWNAAAQLGRAPVLVVTAQDDELISAGLSKTMELLRETGSQDAMVGHRRELVLESRSPRSRLRRRLAPDRDGVLPDRQLDLDLDLATYLTLSYGNVIGEPTSVVVSRSLFDSIGGYDPTWRHAADVDFNLRAVKAGGTCRLVPWRLARRRIHERSATDHNQRTGLVADERERIRTLYARQMVTMPPSMRRRTEASDLLYRLTRWQLPRRDGGSVRNDFTLDGVRGLPSLCMDLLLRRCDPALARIQ